ncbi:protein-(glutamine-N5) methyltransferase, release factor-specific [Enterococcus haemoperoxidus ATCC BAA-382]|uniref:Release factor glutamine methyltransferase n=1 Tax=Enterococcus haemoperoxidus ATCC BAA-382 TaxID=1158608 RepID=R2S9I5_9ENTE|nr:peptide chain release factor N(5)-glutamine methyltransferase [Enterococcus haemoperoxidus]EOH92210.1 protein-(glutamine-N5) methyltransferase, release factor-specific [Enterococcus haemoperoxidus ATCC BAA-382]EOT61895.1 protein-(glutamine-N5) methyltransferase, release factor-specific [Enterococcus haemoperoxidus ATCC BAA-382]
MGNRYFEVLERASSFLEKQGQEGYSILFVFLERKGWTKTDWLLHLKEEITSEDEQQINEDVLRLAQNYPPQYLLEYSDFYGHRFIVNEHTLIPRPETEELVDRCLKENPNERLTVVDVGTGTGAIAISLKLDRPNWQVTAIDISEEALNVAKKNAEQLKVDICFCHGDALKPMKEQKIDILISNPPYISNTEWDLMDESVRTFEPKTALFAENDGLAIYQRLAEEAKELLKPDGKIYLEIGFQQGEAVKQLFQQTFPQKQVQVAQDLSGNDRMVIVSSKKEEG